MLLFISPGSRKTTNFWSAIYVQRKRFLNTDRYVFKWLRTWSSALIIYLHTGLKSRRLKILCFPPEFEMKFHIYVVPKCCCYDEDSVANLAFIRGQRWLVQIHMGRISWRISIILLKEPNSSAKMAMTRKKVEGKLLKRF